MIKDIINDETTKAYCGSTVIAGITGYPISTVKIAARVALGLSPQQRTPIKGMSNSHLQRTLAVLGVKGRWVQYPEDERVTLARWFKAREPHMRKTPIVVNVTGHYVLVYANRFLDTFTEGKVVRIGQAPHRRARVQSVFFVTEIGAPTIALPALPKPSARKDGLTFIVSAFNHEANAWKHIGTIDAADNRVALARAVETWPEHQYLRVRKKPNRGLPKPKLVEPTLPSFTVYKVIPARPGKSRPEPISLGTVRAKSQPEALLVAFKTWPKEIDPKQVQGGFTVKAEPRRKRFVLAETA